MLSEHTKFVDSHYYNPIQYSKIARPHCHKLTFQNKENMQGSPSDEKWGEMGGDSPPTKEKLQKSPPISPH